MPLEDVTYMAMLEVVQKALISLCLFQNELLFAENENMRKMVVRAIEIVFCFCGGVFKDEDGRLVLMEPTKFMKFSSKKLIRVIKIH
ncbi:uncharacterized protein LOC105434875 isoform X2 [Cucumis sativus]|uniref:uncharacterized protein LOC105434875 isoform X2 n=1 Tax=Cucumis sativus TaxID=3659 RepID=UPI0012F4A142|nr:uncharacterized protein LOC105434875 isoform X2 [Cucumis sativus]